MSLTPADRCDADCPAAAVYRMRRDSLFVDEGEPQAAALVLDFCNHHWRRFSPAMFLGGWAVEFGPEDPVPALEGTPS